MKKIISFLLVLSLLCLAGCTSFGGKDYKAKDKVFEFQDLKITLTEAFELDEEETDSVWYESSSGTSVSIDKYPLSNSDLFLFLLQ